MTIKSNKSNKSNSDNKSNKSNIDSISISGEDLLNLKKNNLYYSITFITLLTFITGRSIIDKIKCFLYTHPGSTIKQISEGIGDDDFNKIKATINQDQNKPLLKVVSKIGKENLYELSEEVVNEINSLIELQINKQKKEIKEIKEIKEKLKTRQDFIEKIKSLIHAKKIYKRDGDFIILSLEKLQEENIDLFEKLENNPSEFLELFKESLEDLRLNLKIRFYDYDILKSIPIEKLRVCHLNKLLLLEAKSSTISTVRPQAIKASFECPSCGSIIRIVQLDRKFNEPKSCSCGRKGAFRLISKDMIDSAKVILEDLQENSITGFTKSINCFIQENLTNPNEINKFNPGNEVRVLGILKEIPVLLPTGAISNKSEHALEILEAEEFEPEINLDDFSDEEIKQFKKLSSEIDEKGFEVIRHSICPEVYGDDYIKDTILLQACQPKNNPSKSIRNKSNIFLISGPGKAKTIHLNFADKITQGSLFISGSGSSQVGLTAAVEKSDDGWIPKPGVLVLARELAVIDELNNINDEDKPKLQQGMNEQKISLHKASIHTDLKVTCGILSAANPIHGKFNPSDPLTKQFNLPIQILNRFDLIFALHDVVDYKKDSAIAKKMISRERKRLKVIYDIPFIRKYTLYIRSQPEPIFDDELENYISEIYCSLRKTSEGFVNPRFIEAIIRLSKASARLRLSAKVEKKDIERIIEIFKNSFLGDKELILEAQKIR